jgi:putative transposase
MPVPIKFIPLFTMTQRRKFSDDEKLNVLIQASQKGVSNVLRHYNISYSLFARWTKSFQKKGIDPLSATTGNKSLEEENLRLKKIIADQALSLELKDEELKRIHALVDRRMQ